MFNVPRRFYTSSTLFADSDPRASSAPDAQKHQLLEFPQSHFAEDKHDFGRDGFLNDSSLGLLRKAPTAADQEVERPKNELRYDMNHTSDNGVSRESQRLDHSSQRNVVTPRGAREDFNPLLQRLQETNEFGEAGSQLGDTTIPSVLVGHGKESAHANNEGTRRTSVNLGLSVQEPNAIHSTSARRFMVSSEGATAPGGHELLDATRDSTVALSIWAGKTAETAQCGPSSESVKWNGFREPLEQRLTLDNSGNSIIRDTFRIKCAIDYCLRQDEAALSLDAYIANVPIGNYIPASKVFTLTEPSTDSPFEPSGNVADQLAVQSLRQAILPETLKHTFQQDSFSGDGMQRSLPSRKLLYGSIPSLDVFWYTGGGQPGSASASTVLYLWKWASVGQPPFELKFQQPVTAVGWVNPKYFFLHNGARENSQGETSGATVSSAPSKLLLVATTSTLTLWALHEYLDAASVGILNVVSTPYRCACPNAHVTAIVGHDESGRLFFGDAKGGIYEFVFSLLDPSSESWMSFLYRLAPWSSQSKPKTITVPEKVTAPSMFRRVLGSVIGGTQAIVSLVMDGRRGLLYALDAASNIQLFYLPPPDVTTSKGVTEYPIQSIAALSHAAIVAQMTSVYRQVLRVAHQEVTDVTTLSREAQQALRDQTSEAMIQKNRIISIIPAGFKEGSTIIAIALSADGSRLYLRARLELPLLPRRLDATHTPDIAHFQYIKALDVVNWKPPPSSLLCNHVPTSAQPNSTILPVVSQTFYQNRTFLCVYPQTDSSSAVACVALDESSVLQRQQSSVDGDDANSRGRTLREWCQIVRVPYSDVVAIYEQPLPSLYQHMLDGRGPLPSPYDILGRMYVERLIEIKKQEAEKARFVVDALSHTSRRSVLQGAGTTSFSRTSVSPWGNYPTWSNSGPLGDTASAANHGAPLQFVPPHATACYRYVPPTALHSWTSTQTVPARVFILLTTRGIFQLQQNRFYDLLKQVASSYIENCSATSNPQVSHRNVNPSMDLTQFSCIELSSSDMAAVVPTLLSSRTCLDQYGLAVPNLPPSLRNMLEYVLFNIYASSRLISPEQAMAVAWQVLMFTAGSIRWKKHDVTASLYPLGSVPAQPSLRRPSYRGSPDGSETPFGTVLRKSRQESSLPTPPSTTLLARNAVSVDQLPVTPRGPQSGPAAQFPLPLMLQTLMAWLTHSSVHQGPLFQESLFASFDGVGGSGGPGGCSFATTSFFQTRSHTAGGTGTVVSARVKGLALYLSRILRPFWACPIFETLVVNGRTDECFMSLPAIYRVVSDSSAFRFRKELKKTVAGDAAAESRSNQSSRGSTGSRKRQRSPENSLQGTPNSSDPGAKRIRSQGGSAVSSALTKEESKTHDYAIILTSRFNPEEFEKTCGWLDQLRSVVSQVINILEMDVKRMIANSRDTQSFQSTNPTRPFGSVSPFNDKTVRMLRKPIPTAQSVSHGAKSKVADWSFLRFETELQLLRSMEHTMRLASHYLACCSLLLMEMKEGCVLSSDAFDTLAAACLSDMIVGVPELCEAFQEVMVQHIIPPQRLLDRCSLLFSWDDLSFQCAIHPIITLHRTVMSQCQWKSDTPYMDESLLDHSSLLRSPDVMKGIDALLAVAARPHRTVRLDIGLIATVLAELQLFEVLGDFIARLAEAALLEQVEQQDLTSNSTTNNEGSGVPQLGEATLSTKETESTVSYRADVRFQYCHALCLNVVEGLLHRYHTVNLQNQKEGRPVESVLASAFVKACLALPPDSGVATHSGFHDKIDIAKNPRKMARIWLHYVVLDWINDEGQRRFPVSLEDARTPVYACWVAHRKADLGPDSSEVLSRFFFNNGQFSEFAQFLLHIASKQWVDPTEVLVEFIFIPNYGNKASLKESVIEDTSSCFCSLTSHASSVEPNAGTLTPMQETWSALAEYLHTVRRGFTLEERYAYLAEAREGVATGLAKLNAETSQETSYLGGRKHHDMAGPVKDSRDALRCAAEKVNQALEMVMLQAALCRETIEIALFLCLKYDGGERGLFHQAFSADEAVRKQATDQLLRESPNKYHHLHNVQSLLYLLRWRIYETPGSLLQIIQEFAEASKLLIPYPGLALLQHPSLASSKVLPNTDGATPDVVISRQSIVAAAVFCRGFIGVELRAPDVLNDFISKFLLYIIESRTSHPVYNEESNDIMLGYHEKTELSFFGPSEVHGVKPQVLLYCFSDVLLTLHEAAIAFRDIALRNSQARPSQALTPSTSSAVIPALPGGITSIIRDFKWTTHWWLWPSLLIQQQLNVVDNRVSWDRERQLEGHQKLPIYQRLVEEYQRILDTIIEKKQTPGNLSQKDTSALSARRDSTAVIEQQQYLGLHLYHCMIILLDLQEAWVKQLITMGSSLAYIHLLATDIMVSYLNENSRPASKSGNQRYDTAASNTSARTTPFSVPYADRTSYPFSNPVTDLDVQEITYASTQRNFKPELQRAGEHLSNTKLPGGQSKLTTHLLGMYYKSPSKLQFLSERCQDLVRGCEQVWRQQKEWFAYHQHWIDRCMDIAAAHQHSVSTSLQPAEETDNSEVLSYVIQELRLAERAFLSSLDKLQQRIPILQLYHRIIQRVLTQKITL